MSIYSGIICDRCNISIEWAYATKKEMTIWARRKNWTIGKWCLCPDCNGKKKKAVTQVTSIAAPL